MVDYKINVIKAIRASMIGNLERCTKALKVIYQYQTATEQARHETVLHNGVGFTSHDAEVLTSFSEWLRCGRTFTVKQQAVVKNRLPKYAKQIFEHFLCEGKINRVGKKFSYDIETIWSEQDPSIVAAVEAHERKVEQMELAFDDVNFFNVDVKYNRSLA